MILKKLPETQKGIKRAAKILSHGGIVAIPTETVYGLAANAFCEAAVAKIFAAKGRPQDNPLIVHISDMEMLEAVARDIPQEAYSLAERFWPGPLTMVLPRGDKIPASVSAGLDTVAVRMPSHETARRVIKESGVPLAAPSANVSGSPSPTEAEHVIADLKGKIDAVIMSGSCEVGVESTVVSLCTEPPRLLRPGGVTAEQLSEILSDLVIDKAVTAEPEKGKPVASPGMKYKHYSPRCEVIMFEGEGFAEFLSGKAECGALCFLEEEKKISCPHIAYGSEENPKTLAEGLFSALREADKLGVKTVFAHAPEGKGVGLAVYNRLIRAAGFRVIKKDKIIGLTGPTGAGKSSLHGVAKELGFRVIDCDKVAREVADSGILVAALQKQFGGDVVENGALNRKLLAARAFSSPENTEALNRIMLPAIADKIKSELQGKVLLDAPTLFESGLHRLCDSTVCVLSSEENRKKRIIERDGLDEKAASIRLSAAKSDEFFRSRADYTLYNDQNREDFIEQARKLLTKITEEN